MFEEKPYKLIEGDALEQVGKLASESIDCVISSPPYWNLRDYGFDSQIGLEPTFQEYLEKLLALMDEIKRVLKRTGTAWINLGDTYISNFANGRKASWWSTKIKDEEGKSTSEVGKCPANTQRKSGVPVKSLVLIPHRFAIGCSERGWIIRNDCVWAKRNGMPESVTDRFSKKHEYFFLMAKQAKYYFDLDAVRDESRTRPKDWEHLGSSKDFNVGINMDGGAAQTGNAQTSKGLHRQKGGVYNPIGKNPGDVADFWDIPTRPSSAKHYATFNTELIDKPIKAGCPVGGTILDMFCGTATTGVRALQLDRKFIGIDGNAEYLQIAETRIENAINKQPLFAAV